MEVDSNFQPSNPSRTTLEHQWPARFFSHWCSTGFRLEIWEMFSHNRNVTWIISFLAPASKKPSWSLHQWTEAQQHHCRSFKHTQLPQSFMVPLVHSGWDSSPCAQVSPGYFQGPLNLRQFSGSSCLAVCFLFHIFHPCFLLLLEGCWSVPAALPRCLLILVWILCALVVTGSSPRCCFSLRYPGTLSDFILLSLKSWTLILVFP